MIECAFVTLKDVLLIAKPKWTQDEAIAFEAAKECIGHWIAIFSEKISNEKKKDVPNLMFLKKLEGERGMACKERRKIPFDDPKKIASIRQHYGELVRRYLREVT